MQPYRLTPHPPCCRGGAGPGDPQVARSQLSHSTQGGLMLPPRPGGCRVRGAETVVLPLLGSGPLPGTFSFGPGAFPGRDKRQGQMPGCSDTGSRVHPARPRMPDVFPKAESPRVILRRQNTARGPPPAARRVVSQTPRHAKCRPPEGEACHSLPVGLQK